MATDDVSICNMALGFIGRTPIEALTESSEEAAYCNDFYASSRDALLELHNWPFARKRKALTDGGTPPGHWAYQYQYPTDAIKLRWLQDLSSRRPRVPHPFEIEANDALNAKFILCNIAEAAAVYTARVTAPTMFTPGFIEALALRLAMRLAMPLTRKRTILSDVTQLYRGALATAMANAAAEEQLEATPASDYEEARA